MPSATAVSFAIALSGLMMTTALAQDASPRDDAATEVVPVVPVSPQRTRQQELDKLFGELHQAPVNLNTTELEKKIWASWQRNDSVMAEVLLNQASVALNDRAYDVSEQILNQVLGAYPDYMEAFNRRATLYFALKRYDESLVDIDQVLEFEPRHFGALAGRGMILREQGKLSAAAQALREALSINPHMQSAKEVLKELEKQAPDI